VSLKSIHELSRDPEFRERLKVALILKAVAVLDDETADHLTANKVIQSSDDMTNRAALLAAATGMQDYTIDSQIQAAVDKVWNKL